MPRSREANAARMREQREAEARAQKKIALQSEVMPNSRFKVTQKLADEAAAFAAAIAPVPPEEEAALAATPSAKLLRAKERIIDFKFNFHDYHGKSHVQNYFRQRHAPRHALL